MVPCVHQGQSTFPICVHSAPLLQWVVEALCPLQFPSLGYQCISLWVLSEEILQTHSSKGFTHTTSHAHGFLSASPHQGLLTLFKTDRPPGYSLPHTLLNCPQNCHLFQKRATVSISLFFPSWFILCISRIHIQGIFWILLFNNSSAERVLLFNGKTILLFSFQLSCISLHRLGLPVKCWLGMRGLRQPWLNPWH